MASPRLLYSSTDYGASWQAVDVNPGQACSGSTASPSTPRRRGRSTSPTNGVYKSTDSGATWQRIDDPQATRHGHRRGHHDRHPSAAHVARSEASGQLYRSARRRRDLAEGEEHGDGGTDSCSSTATPRVCTAAAGQGLFFSSDAGDTWERAAGVFGQVQTTALGYADADGHTIIYAATNGGEAATTGGAAGWDARAARAATTDRLVDAGIYRYVVVTPKLTLKLSGLRGGALRLGTRTSRPRAS